MEMQRGSNMLSVILSYLYLLLLLAVASRADPAAVFTQSSNDSLLWGPYRPNLYFGIRPRVPNSLLTGLAWGRVEDYTAVGNDVRFTCEQHSGMAGYGWDVYDPRTGGVQTFRDKGNGIDLETSFVKFDEGGWGARIKGTVRADATPGTGSGAQVAERLKTTVLFTLGLGGIGGVEVRDSDETDGLGYRGDVVLNGRTPDLGEFQLTITDPVGNKHPTHDHPSYATKPLDRTFVHSLNAPEYALWQGKALAFGSMKQTIDAYIAEYTTEKMPQPWQTYTIQHIPGAGNAHVVQKVFEGPFEFDVLFSPANKPTPPTSADLTVSIENVLSAFNDKYKAVFPVQAPFKVSKYLPFSKTIFSNLIGGIGFFHGDHLVDRSYAPEYDEDTEGFHNLTADARARNQQSLEGPYELFTSVPSRPFFPRGFFWDEGFHLLPIVDWDPELVMQIISSWFGLMDGDGWIPREVILGGEARSKVPAEFQTQYPHYANPPTLFMALEALLDHVEEGQNDVTKALLSAWLTDLYPLLQRNYAWYRRTQSGDLKSYDHGSPFSSKEAYRWRGRTPTHILTSGLDDYPRAQPPHPGELHLDLISWIGMMSRSLHRVATFLSETEDAETYAKTLHAIRRNIEDLHWDSESKTYCDVTIEPDYEESVHVCHKGYISIFPFLTGHMGPEHEHLGEVLDLIRDEGELWSPFGVRSLSLKDEFYGSGEDYWRSPVWMNINFLILRSLLDIASHPGPQQSKASKMYTALRKNLVETVYNSWAETGFAWEQYNPYTGHGQRTQHFTGWTSLVVKILAMPEVPPVIRSVRKGPWGWGEEGHSEL